MTVAFDLYGVRVIADPKGKIRRDKLKELGICINGQLPEDARSGRLFERPLVEHGPPVTKGGKCQRCVDVHKKSYRRARERLKAKRLLEKQLRSRELAT